jgi:hypothetical protein
VQVHRKVWPNKQLKLRREGAPYNFDVIDTAVLKSTDTDTFKLLRLGWLQKDFENEAAG